MMPSLQYLMEWPQHAAMTDHVLVVTAVKMECVVLPESSQVCLALHKLIQKMFLMNSYEF